MYDGDRGKDCPEELAKVRSMLDGRLGVPVPLQDDALGLIVVEVDVVLQRSGVLGPHDLHGLSGQALELLELALVKLEPSDTQEFTHGSARHLGARSWSEYRPCRHSLPRGDIGEERQTVGRHAFTLPTMDAETLQALVDELEAIAPRPRLPGEPCLRATSLGRQNSSRRSSASTPSRPRFGPGWGARSLCRLERRCGLRLVGRPSALRLKRVLRPMNLPVPWD